jgi:hypothetical protein
MIDIEWSRSLAYEITGAGNMRRIQPTGKRREQFEPLKIEGEKPLYLRFIELDGSEESLLRFAHAWGLLRSEKQSTGEFIRDWRNDVEGMKAMASNFGAFSEQTGDELQRVPPGTMTKVTQLEVFLRAGTDRPTFVLKPRHLLDAMLLQFCTFVAGDGSLGVCKQCHQPFERGGGDSRRSIAVFCSEKCKNRFHYLERSKR